MVQRILLDFQLLEGITEFFFFFGITEFLFMLYSDPEQSIAHYRSSLNVKFT